MNEIGIWENMPKELEKKLNKNIIFVDPHFFRPTEVDSLIGDASLAKKVLGWAPKISFDELVTEMVEADLKSAKTKKLILSNEKN